MYWHPTEPPTEEQIAAMEQARLEAVDLFNRFKRMLADLPPESLEALHVAFGAISAHQYPGSLANWYEGMVLGALNVRDLRLSETVPRRDTRALTS